MDGLDEELEMKCGQTRQMTVVTTELAESIEQLAYWLNASSRSDHGRPDDVLRAAQAVVEALDLNVVVTGECPFDGEVTTNIARGIRRWDCPVCGAEHEIDHRGDDL